MQKKSLSRLVVGAAAGIALAIAAPLAASAHVTVDPNTADAGGWAYVTFRAPNESTTASTTKVVVHLPQDTPLTSVSYRPTPGWTAAVDTADLPKPVTVSGNTITTAPVSITFDAADGAGIAPGQFQLFTVSLGPIPKTGHIVLPVTQTYSDGQVVEWKATPEDVAKDDTLEPAPVIYITDTPPADEHHSASTAPGTTASADAAATSSADGIALGLSITALVLALGSVLVAAFALRARRRS
jgi:uncharacterized protein YcnI